MIVSALLLFALATALGFSMVVIGVRYHRGSLALGLSHASVALLALGFLFVQIYRGPVDKFNNAAALLFVLALCGGGLLLLLREGGRPPPMVLVSIHAIFALAGLLLLLLGYLHQN
jgi:hypothetical protein